MRGDDIRRRTFVKATGAVTGGGLLGLTPDAVEVAKAATTEEVREYRNWRVREASRVWERGYRGRIDRTIGLTDTGIDARHPDVGPWNGVRVKIDRGEGDNGANEGENTENGNNDGREFTLVQDHSQLVGRQQIEPHTIGPGTDGTDLSPVEVSAGAATQTHDIEFPKRADRVEASLSWSPYDMDLALYIYDSEEDEIVASSEGVLANPESLGADIDRPRGSQTDRSGRYKFVVETEANAVAEYTIDALFYRRRESPVNDPFNVTNDGDKTIGWYVADGRYGEYFMPRDEHGHGTHVSSIMSGTGQASTIDVSSSTVEPGPGQVTANNPIVKSVDIDPDEGVFGSAYGDGVNVVIKGPDDNVLDRSTKSLTADQTPNDLSEWDVAIAEAPAVHTSGSATYTVEFRPLDESVVARVEKMAFGAFESFDETDGDRTDGNLTLHSGLAPNAGLVGLQGLSTPTVDCGAFAEEFSENFNLRTVNMSWGYLGGLPFGAAGGIFEFDVPDAVKKMAEGGILTVAAAGNSATPANGNSAPAVADEAISVVSTGPRDGIVSYSSGGVGGYDEDGEGFYMKPDVTAPGGSVTDHIRAAKAEDPDTPEDELDRPARDYTDMAGTSMASPFVNGTAGLVAQAMEEDAPDTIALPEPADTTFEDVMRLKQVILATASETAFTAAPYHRAHAPTYDFGERDPYEGYGRVNADAAVDAVSRQLKSGTSYNETVGVSVPDDPRAVAGYVTVSEGTLKVTISSMSNQSAHIDLFVYDAANPAQNGEPNIVARAQGITGAPSISVDVQEGTYYVVAKLVNVPGAVNGDDVQVEFNLEATYNGAGSSDRNQGQGGDKADQSGGTQTDGQTDETQVRDRFDRVSGYIR